MIEYVGEGDISLFLLSVSIPFPNKKEGSSDMCLWLIFWCSIVLDDKACEERLWKMKDRRDTNFYLCEVNHDMVIDATYKGNKSRFINHSCQPNTEMQKWLYSILHFINLLWFFYHDTKFYSIMILLSCQKILFHSILYKGELMEKLGLGSLLVVTSEKARKWPMIISMFSYFGISFLAPCTSLITLC